MNRNIANYQVLEWDSQFFGLTIAKLDSLPSSLDERKKFFEELRSKDLSLVYWKQSSEMNVIDLSQLGGELVDKKTTYRCVLNSSCKFAEPCDIYSTNNNYDQLKSLAIASSALSRFRVDKKISSEKVDELYEIWLTNSINKKLADEIFMTREDNNITGFITVKCENQVGTIGLLAVDENSRGKGYGAQLVQAALIYSREQGCQSVDVVTQGNNIAACRLYEKSGFSLESMNYYYHFWL